MEVKFVLTALSALAQESRLAIFRYLVETGPGGASVGTIGDALKLAPATLSFHLKELSRADLIASRQDGRFIWYSANFATMNGLVDYLTRNCCAGQPQLCFPHRAAATAKVVRGKATA
jgi:DNA-binding transcriptional ArsR family regulator